MTKKLKDLWRALSSLLFTPARNPHLADHRADDWWEAR